MSAKQDNGKEPVTKEQDDNLRSLGSLCKAYGLADRISIVRADGTVEVIE
jgi:hypothetical protein